MLTLGCATRLSRPPGREADVKAERREQMKLALTLLLDRQLRTWRVANRLLISGAPLCGEQVRYTFGFFAVDRDLLKADYKEVAPEIGLEPGVRIWETLTDLLGPSSQLRKGDKIVEISGRPVTDFKSFAEAMKGPWETGQLSMKVQRGPRPPVSVSLKGVPACDYRAGVMEKDLINAFADGKNVYVTTGMIRFAQSDDELAIVLGHEFAHNALGHVQQMRAQSMAGMLLDLAILIFGGVDTGGLFSQVGRLVYSREFEADADYMGLYLAARAGYQIQMAPNLWRRMAVEHPGSIKGTWLATHPSSPERAVTLRETILEIEEKRAKGLPLLPEKKGQPSPAKTHRPPPRASFAR